MDELRSEEFIDEEFDDDDEGIEFDDDDEGVEFDDDDEDVEFDDDDEEVEDAELFGFGRKRRRRKKAKAQAAARRASALAAKLASAVRTGQIRSKNLTGAINRNAKSIQVINKKVAAVGRTASRNAKINSTQSRRISGLSSSTRRGFSRLNKKISDQQNMALMMTLLEPDSTKYTIEKVNGVPQTTPITVTLKDEKDNFTKFLPLLMMGGSGGSSNMNNMMFLLLAFKD